MSPFLLTLNANEKKTVHFQTFFKKWKVIFCYSNIYHSPFDSYRNSKTKYKIEAPYCSVQVPNSETKKAHCRHPFLLNDKTFCRTNHHLISSTAGGKQDWMHCSFGFLFSFVLSWPINFLFDLSILPAHFSFYVACF